MVDSPSRRAPENVPIPIDPGGEGTRARLYFTSNASRQGHAAKGRFWTGTIGTRRAGNPYRQHFSLARVTRRERRLQILFPLPLVQLS